MQEFTSPDGHTLHDRRSSVRYGHHPHNGLRRSMDKNNNRLRRSSRCGAVLASLAAAALVSGVPVDGPRARAAPAAPVPVAAAVAPLEPIVLPVARVSRHRRRAGPADAPAVALRLGDRGRSRRHSANATGMRAIRPISTASSRAAISICSTSSRRSRRAACRRSSRCCRSSRAPSIRSRTRTAARPGLWQIIPGTGKRLGVEQNWWFDGRRDVLESTRAALDYLEQLAAAVRRRLAARGRRLQLRRRQRRPRAEEGGRRRQAAGLLGHQELLAGRDAHVRAAPARDRRARRRTPAPSASRCPSCATSRGSPSSRRAARSTWRWRPSSPASPPMRCTR